jgi:hypothetical protein
MRAIQYAAKSEFNNDLLRILDTPPSRGKTERGLTTTSVSSSANAGDPVFREVRAQHDLLGILDAPPSRGKTERGLTTTSVSSSAKADDPVFREVRVQQ